MMARLSELGLNGLMPVEAWPQTYAVRELATKITEVSEGYDSELFVAADSRK